LERQSANQLTFHKEHYNELLKKDDKNKKAAEGFFDSVRTLSTRFF